MATWFPERHRAEKLLAAAAAIGDDFPPLLDPDPAETSTNADPDCVAVPEITVANPDQSLAVAEGAAANPEMTSSLSPEIYFVDLEPDHLPFIAEDAAAMEPELFIGQGPVPDQEPETKAGVVPKVVAQDKQLDDAVRMSDPLTGSDADVASTPLAPAEEQLHASVSEAPALDAALDEEVGALADDRWPPNYLPAKITQDEISVDRAVDVSWKEPLATLAEIAGSLMLRSGTQDESDGSKDSAHEAALSGQAGPEAKKPWIALKTNYSGARSSENTKHNAHRAALRSRRNLPVLSSALNVPPRRFPGWPLSGLHTGILALALVDFLLVGWRVDIVRWLPQTASFYELAGIPVNLRGLAFHGITTSTVRHDGTSVLVVEGNIVNDTRKPLRVPQLRFALRDASAQEIYSWTASADRTSLPPGQAMTFRARLASPPAVAQDVVLRFVNRRDVVALIH